MNRKYRTTSNRSRAFTLVELLVVMGIISVLMGVLLPTLGRARAHAREVRSMAGMRELLAGYTAYHEQNRGSLLWGFTPTSVARMTIQVRDPVTGRILTGAEQTADRYPWRLLRYVSNVWPIIHAHDDMPRIPTSATDPFLDFYNLSLTPTYGINAIFLGGHRESIYGGFMFDSKSSPATYWPNTGKHVAFKASEIRRASSQIVFADAQIKNFPSLEGKGSHYVTPPIAAGRRFWDVDAKGRAVATTSLQTGLPNGWFTKNTVVGFFDGHVEARRPKDLLDMRLWAPRATSPDYDYQNP